MSPESPTPVPLELVQNDGSCLAGSGDIERIFREHNDALVRFIAARLGSKQEASEVAQEAYVKVLSLDHLEAVSYLRAFLFKTAANLATDRLRARSRRGRIVQVGGLESAVFELSPERELDGQQTLERLRDAIDELPTKCREAFLLYRLEELSVEEVAARLGLRERMVWRYIARALDYIRIRVNDGNHSESRPKPKGEP
jgi:RNA polymerase sigma factor (sigma-70 family)